MDKHPNQFLNEFVARYQLLYLRQCGYQKTETNFNQITWNLLRLAGIDPTSNPDSMSNLAHEAAIIQRHLVLTKKTNTSLRSVRKEYPNILPVVSHGPQAWLIATYLKMLQHIYELDKGSMKYQPKSDIYRNIVENVSAARMMFEDASKRLAKSLVDIYANTFKLGLYEGGSGFGGSMFTNLSEFHKYGIYPDFLLSDIAIKTKLVAENYFRDHGYRSNYFPWKKVDIGNPKHLAEVAEYFKWNHLVVNVNFIVHERESIAQKFFSAMSRSLPKADLVISEFFLPPGYPDCAPDPTFPWWFVGLHEYSGQKLRTESQFMKFPQKYGYRLFNRLDHQTHNGHAVTSTLFLQKK